MKKPKCRHFVHIKILLFNVSCALSLENLYVRSFDAFLSAINPHEIGRLRWLAHSRLSKFMVFARRVDGQVLNIKELGKMEKKEK
jgi:hypothetical protein